MKSFNIDRIKSFGNDKIKRVVLEQTFDLAAAQHSEGVLGQVLINDNNIVPVYMRVLLMWPLEIYGTGVTRLGEGLGMVARINLDSPAANNLLLVYASCSSVYSPIYEKEFYGAIAQPISDFYELNLEATVYTVRASTIPMQINGRIYIEFYYIPIRYP